MFHKKLRKQRKKQEDGWAVQQRNREVAEEAVRDAAQTGDRYDELVAEGARHVPVHGKGVLTKQRHVPVHGKGTP